MIEFQKLRWKNLLSYGNFFTEIDFQKNNMTLISGKNGSGKSTIGEALTFALFGIPFRNINKPNLLNSINEKDCLVEVEFNIGKKQYKVRRGIKPTIFEIYSDGKIIDQESKSKDYQKFLEQNILKLNYKSFTQLVFLGSSNFVPFMQLSAQDRREVIEELLDIRVFSRMNIVLKEKASILKENLKDLDRDIAIAKEKLDMQREHIKKIQNKNTEAINTNNEEIAVNNEAISKLVLDMDSIKNDINQRNNSINDLQTVKGKLQKYEELERKLSSQLSKLAKTIQFYSETHDCPTCNQEITSDFKQKVIQLKQSKIQEFEKAYEDLGTKKKEISDRFDAIIKVQQEITCLNLEYQNKNASITGINAYIQKLQQENERLLKTDLGDQEETNKLADYEQKYSELLCQRDEHIDTRHMYEIASELLKDSGIKTRIIRQYLPVMNKLINKYLSSMDFFVNFNLDENFKEVIKSRYRDEFEYNSFSQGQKFRIDMALLLTWREISRKKNSTNTNILILDEVFDSSLDAGGTEDFMKLLRVLSKKTHIFVISHKPDVISDRFDSHLKVEIKNNFSIIS
jgi:DNA repair exonuclease SbcCD ATPase subunit